MDVLGLFLFKGLFNGLILEGILSEGFLRHRLWGVAYFREDVFFGEVKRRPIEILGHSLFFFRCLLFPLNFNKRKVKIHTPMIVNEF